MYYVNNETEKWLLSKGMKPSCPEKRITLLEAAQEIYNLFEIDCHYMNYTTNDFHGVVNGYYKQFPLVKHFKTIPEALSWSITSAIEYIDSNNIKPIK